MKHIKLTIVPPTGHVFRFFYDLKTQTYKQWTYPYTLSKKGRILFNHHPALFNGMRPERLGQFEKCPYGLQCEMVSTNENYHYNKAQFLSIVAKLLAKIKLKGIAKPLGLSVNADSDEFTTLPGTWPGKK